MICVKLKVIAQIDLLDAIWYIHDNYNVKCTVERGILTFIFQDSKQELQAKLKFPELYELSI